MSTSEQLQGAVALVAGASSGISEATAIALAEHGPRVAIVGPAVKRPRVKAALLVSCGWLCWELARTLLR
jgi:NAD(P)-dependent dehydrogenase (short-subunit alcohol dehydrogenase family)